MFDWDDQELVNILWAEADDSDDRIVPFPCGSEEMPLDISGDLTEKEQQNEEIANRKASKQKKPVSSSELDGVKQEKHLECDKIKILSAAGHSVDSWNKSLASVSMDFQDPSNDKEKDLVGYDWDNIGSSYEDLDRIFSNGDPAFGCRSLNADELWSSSNMEYSSLGSGAPSTSEQCGKTEDMLDQAQPFSLGYSNLNDLTCCVPQNKHATMNHLFVENKIDGHKNLLRRRKISGEESKARPYQDLPKTWFSSENQFLQLEGHYAKTGQEPASSPCDYISTPLFSPSGPTHMHIQDPVTPIFPQSAFTVPWDKSKTSNKFPGSSANPLTMTPQEKIRKLRRRQQMRAMLAIQKQQKQFGHETSESQPSICQKHDISDQMQLAGGNLEVNVSTLDMNLPAEQDYSGTMSLASDDCSLEGAMLYQLQDIVAKLDVKLRLCIRDSLCRLAQSATQRQHAKDTGGNTMKQKENYLKILPKEDTKPDNRFSRTREAETDTNPIDRIVAHLLFHRPIEFSENLKTT